MAQAITVTPNSGTPTTRVFPVSSILWVDPDTAGAKIFYNQGGGAANIIVTETPATIMAAMNA